MYSNIVDGYFDYQVLALALDKGINDKAIKQ